MLLNCLKKVCLPALICAVSVNCIAAPHISLKLAMTRKIVSLNATSLGGYMGKSIRLSITNISPKEQTIDIDPGMVFVPEDTSYQDLVLLGGDVLVLAPAQKVEADLQTFCGKSYGHCPRANVHYTFRKQGDSTLVKMLAHVKSNNVPLELAQRGVWTFTNGHCLPTVYSARYPKESDDFVKYVADLKKVKVPRFYASNRLDNRAGHDVIVAGSERTYLNMHWKTDEGYRHMHLTILKENGDVYKKIEADQVIDKEGSTVQVEFDPHREPHGRYIVRLRDDGNTVWDEKMVVVSGNPCDNMY